MKKQFSFRQLIASVVILLIILFSFVQTVTAQTSLSYGDVLIVGWNNNITTSGNRDYQWVPLVNLAPGTTIKFSGTGFNSASAANATNNARVTAGITIWVNTTGATIAAGTVITNDQGGGSSLGTCSFASTSCACGPTTGAFMVQSTSGGRFFVYDGGTSSGTSTDFAASTNPTTLNGTPITYFAFQGTQSGYTTWLTSGTTSNFLTYLPSDLTSYSLFLNGNAIGGYYNGPRLNSSAAAFRAAVLNPANWTTVSGAGSTVTYPTGNFILGGVFAFSGASSITLNQRSGAYSLNSNLAATDSSTGRQDTISVVHAPVHGSLGGFPFIGTSSGSFITPSGLSYSADTSYTGADSFTVRISNGLYAVSQTFHINIIPFAPTSLTYGDVLITGVNNNVVGTSRSYQWVPLRSLGPGTVIKFTNAGFLSSATSNTANNAITASRSTTVWTNTTGTTIPAGTVITNDALGNTSIGSCSHIPAACGCGSTGITMTQSTSGGSIYIYNGGTTHSTSSDYSASASTATFQGTPISILGLQGTQSWSSWLTSGTATGLMTWLPSDLSSYALFLGTSAIGGTYTGPRTGGTAASYRAAILNPTNWSTVRDTATIAYDNTNFNIVAAGHAPSFVSGSVQYLTFCDNAGIRGIASMLKVNDADTGNTITYSLASAPSHGTASVSYTTTSTGGIIVPAGMTYTAAAGFTGRDTFSVMVSDGTSSVTTSIRVLVNPSPAVPSISGASYVCNAGATTLTGTPSGGFWGSMDARASVNAVTGVVRGLAAGTGNIYYNSPYNSYSCRSQAIYTLTVVVAPSAGTLSGASSVCPGASTTITPTVSGGTWSVNFPGIASVSAGTVTGVATGTATVSYTVTNSCFSSTTTKPVSVPGPTTPPTITGTTSCVCEGGATITVNNSLAGGVWSIANTSLATISTGGVITGIAAGNTYVSYTYTNSCGMARSSSRLITVKPLPNAGTISGASSIVRGNNALMTVSATGGTWSSADVSLATVNAVGRVYATAVGSDTVKYTVTNTCGTAVANKVITITAFRQDISDENGFAIPSGVSINVFPNPTTGIVTVELQGATGITEISLTDITGKVIIANNSESTKNDMELSNLPAGTYLLNVRNGGKKYTEKVVVQ